MLEVTRKLVELLDLSPTGDDHFQGDSEDLGFPNVFGGQVLGQSLMAACRTVEGRLPHSLHAYFLRPGNHSLPIDYEVQRVRDGGSFSVRRVIARQDGKEIIGLESMREQLEFLDNLSLEAQRDLFMQTLTESREIESLMDDLIRAWRTGDTEFMEENLLREMAQFRELHRTIVVDRNVAWVDSIEQMLREEDDYLVVVGALHMVGANGVPRLLSARGHAIEQLRGGD